MLFYRQLFRDPERLGIVWEEASFAGFTQYTCARKLCRLEIKAQSFEDMALFGQSFNLTGVVIRRVAANAGPTASLGCRSTASSAELYHRRIFRCEQGRRSSFHSGRSRYAANATYSQHDPTQR